MVTNMLQNILLILSVLDQVLCQVLCHGQLSILWLGVYRKSVYVATRKLQLSLQQII